jgi:hypothetical protein
MHETNVEIGEFLLEFLLNTSALASKEFLKIMNVSKID